MIKEKHILSNKNALDLCFQSRSHAFFHLSKFLSLHSNEFILNRYCHHVHLQNENLLILGIGKESTYMLRCKES